MASAVATPAEVTILGVFAHPDDETLCAGGTLATYAAAGAHLNVVSLTREAGQIRDAEVATRATLGAVREQEMKTACKLLGVERAWCLDWVDGTLTDRPPGELVDVVAGIVEEIRPDVTITFGEDGVYGHPDHISIGEATTAAWWRVMSGDAPTSPALSTDHHRSGPRLFHTYFSQRKLFMRDELAAWALSFSERFKATREFARALSVFTRETITMGFASDHIDVEWFAPGSYLIEQGESGRHLYFILSGTVEIRREVRPGRLEVVDTSGVGEFVGETAVVSGGPRNAHVVAVDDVTCLVFSSGEHSTFGGRGAGARLGEQHTGREGGDLVEERILQAGHVGATTCIDVRASIQQKIAAIEAYRSQYAMDPDMFPPSMLEKMFGWEYFTRVAPAPRLETSLLA